MALKDFLNDYGDLILGGAETAAEIYFADKAATSQTDAAQKALDLEREMYYQGREDIAPWREAGAGAINELPDFIDAGPGEFEASPGYEFVRDEGLNALRNIMSATGRLGSGAHIRGGERYATDLASTEYDNFLARWRENQLNPKLSIAGMGQTSGTTSANLGANFANQAGRALGYAGDAEYNRSANISNSLANFTTGVAMPWMQNYANSYGRIPKNQLAQFSAPGLAGVRY